MTYKPICLTRRTTAWKNSAILHSFYILYILTCVDENGMLPSLKEHVNSFLKVLVKSIWIPLHNV